MAHPFRKIIRLMRRLEMAAHQERRILVLGLHPLYDLVCHYIGRESVDSLTEIAHPGPRVGTVLESRVTVFALVMEDRIPVKALRLRLQMPLAHKAGIVAAFLKNLRYGRHGNIKTVFQSIYPVHMAVSPSKDGSTARC